MSLQLYERVRLRKDFPEYSLKAGEEGAVLEIVTDPRKAYLVEFSDEDGEATATEFFTEDQLEAVH